MQQHQIVNAVILVVVIPMMQVGVLLSQLKKIEAHIRRRLRSRLVDQQKSKRHLYRKLTRRGVPRGQAAKAVFSNQKRWALSLTFALAKAYPVGWFTGHMGQAIRSDRQLPHWLELRQWIRLT